MAKISLQTGDSFITISGPSTIIPSSSKITGDFKIILGTSTATADLSKIGKAAASTVVEIHGPSTDYHEVISKGYVYVLAGTNADLKTAVVKLPIAKKADSTAVKLHFNDYKTDVTVTKDGALDHAPDGTTAVTLAASATSIDEGQAVTYTATLASPAPVGGVSVPYTLSGISAADFGLASLTGSIAIAAGKTTGTLVLNAAADNTTEGVETLSVALQAAPRIELGATTTASTTIVDTSKTPVIIPTATLASSTATVDETAPNNVVTYTATLSSPAAAALSIPYTLAGTGITAGDFVGLTGLTGNINIGVGKTTGTLVLTTTADSIPEGAETLSVTLGTNSSNLYTMGTTTTQSTVIADTSVVTNVAVNAPNGTPANDATIGNVTYTVAPPTSNYTYNINGFNAGDKLVFPAATTFSFTNAVANDGNATITGSVGGSVVTVELTGMPTALDTFFTPATFNTAFGTGSIA